MLAFLNLPMQITFWLMVACVSLVALWKRRFSAILWASILAAFAFIPSCTGVMYCVDQFRYRKFEFATAKEALLDGYVELPILAKDIVIHRKASGHQVLFSITTDELREWVLQMRSLCPELNRNMDDEIWVGKDGTQISDSSDNFDGQNFDNFFLETGWIGTHGDTPFFRVGHTGTHHFFGWVVDFRFPIGFNFGTCLWFCLFFYGGYCHG